MATIKPFKAVRPAQDKAARVAALPYDVYNREEAKQEIQKEKLTFLKIDRPETQFPDDMDMYDPKVDTGSGYLFLYLSPDNGWESTDRHCGVCISRRLSEQCDQET